MSALTDRDTNLQPTSHPSISEKQAPAGEENQPQDMQQHKKLLDHKSVDSDGCGHFKVQVDVRLRLMMCRKSSQTYISPSDAILSPASQKLADFRQKQINKQYDNLLPSEIVEGILIRRRGTKHPAARTLFARTASSCSSGFDDFDASQEKQ